MSLERKDEQWWVVLALHEDMPDEWVCVEWFDVESDAIDFVEALAAGGRGIVAVSLLEQKRAYVSTKMRRNEDEKAN